MKKQVLFIVTVLFSGFLFAQDIQVNQVPQVVVNQFQNDFPKAKDIEWELSNNVYNVDFEIGWGNDYEAWYSAEGKLIKVEEEISKNDLPNAVTQAIGKNYPDFRIDDVEKVTEGNKIHYKVEIENREMEQVLHMDPDGNVVTR